MKEFFPRRNSSDFKRPVEQNAKRAGEWCRGRFWHHQKSVGVGPSLPSPSPSPPATTGSCCTTLKAK